MDKNQGYSILKAVMLEMAGALRWGIIPQLHPPMSHGPVTMIRTASGSMNGDITATIWPLWNRIFQTG